MQGANLLGQHTTTSSHFATTGTSSTLTVGGKQLANIENMKNGFFDEASNSAIVNFQSKAGTLKAADASSTVNYRVFGSGRNDEITTAAGNDIIWGSSGNDTINGGAGNDYIVGGKGKNKLTGGAGDDTFVIDAEDGRSRSEITDFKYDAAEGGEKDHIILENIGANGVDGLNFRHRRGSNSIVEIVLDGRVIANVRTTLLPDELKARVKEDMNSV